MEDLGKEWGLSLTRWLTVSWLSKTLVEPAVFRFDRVGPLKPEFGSRLGGDTDEFRVTLRMDIAGLICSRSVIV